MTEENVVNVDVEGPTTDEEWEEYYEENLKKTHRFLRKIQKQEGDDVRAQIQMVDYGGTYKLVIMSSLGEGEINRIIDLCRENGFRMVFISYGEFPYTIQALELQPREEA